jgi:hypothetical protein
VEQAHWGGTWACGTRSGPPRDRSSPYLQADQVSDVGPHPALLLELHEGKGPAEGEALEEADVQIVPPARHRRELHTRTPQKRSGDRNPPPLPLLSSAHLIRFHLWAKLLVIAYKQTMLRRLRQAREDMRLQHLRRLLHHHNLGS